MSDFNQLEVQIAFITKLNRLQQNDLPLLTQENLERVIEEIWIKKPPKTLHEALNDILSLTADKVIQKLSLQAILDGEKQGLSDFEDLLGGK